MVEMFELESLLMSLKQEAGKEVINDFSWMKDHDYKGEMRSTARILENSSYYYPKVPEVPETCTGRITNDSLASKFKS